MVAGIVASSLAVTAGASAAVTTITVTGFGDPSTPAPSASNCQAPAGATQSCPSLRDAELAAEAASTATNVPTIQLSAGTYKLDDWLMIEQPMKIVGAGMSGAPGGTTLDQVGAGPVIVSSLSSGSLTVQQLELTGATDSNQGGGIASNGSLELDSVLVTGNSATGSDGSAGEAGVSAQGGGIYESGSLTLNNSVVKDNNAQGGNGGAPVGSGTGGVGGNASGGGIYITGQLTATDSTISDNQAIGGAGGGSVTSGATGGGGGAAQGGGIEAVSNPLALTGTTVDGNTATGGVGGIATTDGLASSGGAGGIFVNGSSLTAQAITVADNGAVGGAAQGATGRASGGDGGGIVVSFGSAKATIVDSTVTGNYANAGAVSDGATGGGSFGGGMYIQAGGQVVLASDTLAANSSVGSGPALTQGGNIAFSGGTLSIADTIFVDGGATQPGLQNCELNAPSGFTDAGHNLEEDSISQCGLSPANHDVLVAAGTPVLATTLAANGGPTDTLALSAISPAIGAGDACVNPLLAGSPTLAVDQRGLPRPATCDIGAFQHQLPAGGAALLAGVPAPGHTLTCTPSAFTGDGLTYSYSWLHNGAAISAAPTLVVTGADQRRSLSCRITATGFYGGTASATSASIVVQSLRIRALSESHSTWSEGTALARFARKVRKPPVGTTFSFKLNLPANVSFTFTHTAAGRRSGKACVKQTRHNANHKRCTRTLTSGKLTFAAAAGTRKLAFDGLISHRNRLPPGRYAMTVTATAAGATSNSAKLSFTIAA